MKRSGRLAERATRGTTFWSQVGSLILPIIQAWTDSYKNGREEWMVRLLASVAGVSTVTMPIALGRAGERSEEGNVLAKFLHAFDENAELTALGFLMWFFAAFAVAVVVARSLDRASALVLYVVAASLWGAVLRLGLSVLEAGSVAPATGS